MQLHQALHIEIDTSITSAQLIRIFKRVQAEHGLPKVLRTDNGPEFLGEVFANWTKAVGMAIQYVQPGKPIQNAYVERFNCTLPQRVSRLVRATLLFSKKLTNHIGAIRNFICHYNLVQAAALHG